MGFRTVEITGPAELHVRNGSLIIEKEVKKEHGFGNTDQTKTRKCSKKEPEIDKILIPLDDINSIICMGAGVRISTMAMAQICANKISMTMLDENYRPAGILTSYEANSKQSLIMRSVAAGLLTPFGIHYQNLFNAYNLADDLIEPFRPSLDLIAYNIKEDNIQLSREERKQLVSVLLHAVHIGKEKVSILQAIDMLISQYRSYVLEECEEVDLPQILPIEIIKQIKE